MGNAESLECFDVVLIFCDNARSIFIGFHQETFTETLPVVLPGEIIVLIYCLSSEFDLNF